MKVDKTSSSFAPIDLPRAIKKSNIKGPKRNRSTDLPLLESSPRINKQIEANNEVRKDNEGIIEQMKQVVIVEQDDTPLPPISSGRSTLIDYIEPDLATQLTEDEPYKSMRGAAKRVMEMNRTELCRDMTGKFHVIKDIRDQRHKVHTTLTHMFHISYIHKRKLNTPLLYRL